MNKIVTYIYLLFLSTHINSAEPTLATLRAVHSNESQKLSIGMYEFVCRPYGVLTLEELYKMAELDSVCKKSIDEFYLKNPLSRYYSQNILKNRQLYHIEFKGDRCILYAKGKTTISELLLKKGLAVKKPRFQDEEFEHNFTQTQEYAKSLKLGLFKNKITKKCITELYKN